MAMWLLLAIRTTNCSDAVLAGIRIQKGHRTSKANTALYWLTHTRHAQQTLTQTERQDTSVFLGGSTATLTTNEPMSPGSRAVTTFVLGRTPCGKRESRTTSSTVLPN